MELLIPFWEDQNACNQKDGRQKVGFHQEVGDEEGNPGRSEEGFFAKRRQRENRFEIRFEQVYSKENGDETSCQEELIRSR